MVLLRHARDGLVRPVARHVLLFFQEQVYRNQQNRSKREESEKGQGDDHVVSIHGMGIRADDVVAVQSGLLHDELDFPAGGHEDEYGDQRERPETGYDAVNRKYNGKHHSDQAGHVRGCPVLHL